MECDAKPSIVALSLAKRPREGPTSERIADSFEDQVDQTIVPERPRRVRFAIIAEREDHQVNSGSSFAYRKLDALLISFPTDGAEKRLLI